jgi:hypothetical protein
MHGDAAPHSQCNTSKKEILVHKYICRTPPRADLRLRYRHAIVGGIGELRALKVAIQQPQADDVTGQRPFMDASLASLSDAQALEAMKLAQNPLSTRRIAV